VESNAKLVAAAEQQHAAKVTALASAPVDPKNAVHVRKDLTVVGNFFELAAAKKRGDETVLCLPATLQEEFSAH
jgi:hypothetical protein